MLKDVVDRVEKRLAAVGLAAAKASTDAGLSADAIRNMKRAAETETGRQGISTFTLTQLAPVLRTTAGWLLDGTGQEEAEPQTVPLIGYVGAGAEAHFYAIADEHLDQVEAPEGATPETRAAEVRGTSLGPLFERWLIFYDDVRTPVTEDLIGRLCIVGLANGKVLVKKLRKSRQKHPEGRQLYDLESNTEPTLEAQEVDWAARVKQMTPR